MDVQNTEGTAPTVPSQTNQISYLDNSTHETTRKPVLVSAGATEALIQLELLGYKPGDRVFLRFFYGKTDPRKSGDKGRKLAAIFPDLPWQKIETYQNDLRGVYFVVNGGGDCDAEVIHGKAIFYEHDKLPRDFSASLWKELGLPEPTLQIDTGGKSVWSIWVFDTPIEVEEWRSLQSDLLDFSAGDNTLKNPSRVTRLAGYQHQETGQPATILSQSGKRYSYQALRDLVPTTQTEPQSSPVSEKWTIELAREALAYIPKRIPNQGDYPMYRNILWAVKSEFGEAVAIDLLEAHSPSKDCGWDVSQVCRSGGDKVTIGTLVYWATQHGWKPPFKGTKSRKGATNQGADGDDTEEKPGKQSIADLLLEVATQPGVEYWKTPDGVAYADVLVDEVRQTYPLRRKQFKLWVSYQLYLKHEKQANSEALQSCLNNLEGKALFEGQERPVWQRLGQADGKIYLDLGTQDWKVVEVSATGYRVIDSRDCPVRFTRSDGNLPLLIPEPGGTLQDLWTLLPVKAESRALLLGFLIFCLVPTGDKPILVLIGSKGSGKSTVAMILKRLIDPGKGALLPAVGDRRQMAVTASNRWLLIFDNLTSLTTEQQDTLCCASTGAGFSTRTLHTDLDETFVEYTRPQILTSVDLVPSRSDLLDRCVLVGLDRISDDDRLTDEELEERIESLAPKLLGALLDCVSEGLKNLATTRPGKLPRMASFARFAIAAEPAYRDACQGYEFLRTYQNNIGNAQTAAIEANPVAAAILSVLDEATVWQGTTSELLTAIQAKSDESRVKKLSSRGLGKTLNGTVGADLKAVGVHCDSHRDNRGVKWTIERISQPDLSPIKTTQTAQTAQPAREPLPSKDPDSGEVSVVSLDSKPKTTQTTQLTTQPKTLPNKDLEVSVVCVVSEPHLSGQAKTEKEPEW